MGSARRRIYRFCSRLRKPHRKRASSGVSQPNAFTRRFLERRGTRGYRASRNGGKERRLYNTCGSRRRQKYGRERRQLSYQDRQRQFHRAFRPFGSRYSGLCRRLQHRAARRLRLEIRNRVVRLGTRAHRRNYAPWQERRKLERRRSVIRRARKSDGQSCRNSLGKLYVE